MRLVEVVAKNYIHNIILIEISGSYRLPDAVTIIIEPMEVIKHKTGL